MPRSHEEPQPGYSETLKPDQNIFDQPPFDTVLRAIEAEMQKKSVKGGISTPKIREVIKRASSQVVEMIDYTLGTVDIFDLSDADFRSIVKMTEVAQDIPYITGLSRKDYPPIVRSFNDSVHHSAWIYLGWQNRSDYKADGSPAKVLGSSQALSYLGWLRAYSGESFIADIDEQALEMLDKLGLAKFPTVRQGGTPYQRYIDTLRSAGLLRD